MAANRKMMTTCLLDNIGPIQNLICKKISDGESVLVTGSLGSGKSTLLQYLEQNIDDYCKITTKKQGDQVLLFWREQSAVIGRYNGGVMQPVLAGFALGIRAVKQFLNSSSPLMIIDEIGFLESRASDYLDVIESVINTRQICIVHRKDRNALRDSWFNMIDNAIDLDDY